MECVICKHGNTENGNVTVTLERENAIVLIKNVPAQVCNNCGHYYLSEEMTDIVLNKGNEALQNGAELEILRLNAA